MRGRRIVWLALAAALLLGAATPAAAAPLFPPGGFRLPASNGYSIHAIAFDGDPRGEHDEVILFVTRKHSAALYFAHKRVQVTETTISADLGSLGSIDLRFVPSGKPRFERSACNRRPVEFDAGFYEGRFDFEGEEGFTEAHRSRARGEIRLQASLICGRGGDEGVGGHAPGARLMVRRHRPRGSVEFEATKNSPTRPSRFRASIEERRGNLAIEREVTAEAGAGAFDFDVPDQIAKLKPPSPFSGAARFAHPNARRGILQGSLSIDFPGRSNVSLDSSRGSLVRWVQNPSHPFRLR